MVKIRLFAQAREAAGLSSDVVDGNTVSEVLNSACAKYGGQFETILGSSRVWLNGEPADEKAIVSEADEVAVLPPFSGG